MIMTRINSVIDYSLEENVVSVSKRLVLLGRCKETVEALE